MYSVRCLKEPYELNSQPTLVSVRCCFATVPCRVSWWSGSLWKAGSERDPFNTRLQAFAAALVNDRLRAGGRRLVVRLERLRDEVHGQVEEPADVRVPERLDGRAREQPAQMQDVL